MFLQIIGMMLLIVAIAALSMTAAVSVLLGKDSLLASEEREQEAIPFAG